MENEKEDMSFEQAMTKLEDITGKLENGETTLEESMKLFTEGMELAKKCTKQIETIENKIKMLVKDENENLSEADYEE